MRLYTLMSNQMDEGVLYLTYTEVIVRGMKGWYKCEISACISINICLERTLYPNYLYVR